jgi:hypothetical protein
MLWGSSVGLWGVLGKNDFEKVIIIPTFSDGFSKAVSQIIVGIVMVLFARAYLISAGHESLVFLINILSIIGIIMLFDVIPYWGITYTIGWLFGIAYIGSQLMEGWEVPIYIAIGLFFLYVKLSNKFR